MFPIDPVLLMLLKFFIVITSIAFWVKLGIDALFRHHGIGRYFSERDHRYRHKGDE